MKQALRFTLQASQAFVILLRFASRNTDEKVKMYLDPFMTLVNVSEITPRAWLPVELNRDLGALSAGSLAIFTDYVTTTVLSCDLCLLPSPIMSREALPFFLSFIVARLKGLA